MTRMLRLALSLLAALLRRGVRAGSGQILRRHSSTRRRMRRSWPTAWREFVAMQLPAASSTVVLDPTPSDQAGNALTPAFAAALRDRGFAVAEDRAGRRAWRASHPLSRDAPGQRGSRARCRSMTAPRRRGSSSATPPAGCRPAARSRCGRWRRRTMSGTPDPPADGPDRSPPLLPAPPRRGAGVRRLNSVPILFFVGGAMLVVAAIGYTYRDRMMQAVANAQAADQKKPEPANGAAVLNGAPLDGEVQSAVYRPANPHPAQQPPDQQAQVTPRRPTATARVRRRARTTPRRRASRPGRPTTRRFSSCRRIGSRPHSRR